MSTSINKRYQPSDKWEARFLIQPLAVSQALTKSMSSTLGAGIGVSQLFFEFKNNITREARMVSFSGYGLSIGMKTAAGDGTWVSFKPFDNMSFDDLDGAAGRITSLSVGYVAGYSKCYISAFRPIKGKVYFDSLNMSGLEFGVGASAIANFGIWKVIN